MQVIRVPTNLERTILSMELIDVHLELTSENDIIVSLVQPCQSCEFWSWQLSEWADIYAVNSKTDDVCCEAQEYQSEECHVRTGSVL